MKWALRLSQGLSKTAAGLSLNLTSILKGEKIDKQVMEELEDLLISSDFGVNTSQEIITSLEREKLNNLDQEKIKEFLSNKISSILKKRYAPLNIQNSKKPYVILVIGVNGVGMNGVSMKNAIYSNPINEKLYL